MQNIYEESDEEMSEETRLWQAQSRAQFLKEFPLRQTASKRPAATPLGASTSSLTTRAPSSASAAAAPVAKKLNFDDSFSAPSTNQQSLQIQLLEAQQEMSLLKNRLIRAQEDNERLKKVDCERSERVEQLLHENTDLKKKIVDLETERDMNNTLNSSHIEQEKVLIDDYRAVASKLATWHRFTEVQLKEAVQVLREIRAWTSAHRDRIRDAYTCVEPVEVNAVMVEQLRIGSVFDFDSPASIEQPEELPLLEEHENLTGTQVFEETKRVADVFQGSSQTSRHSVDMDIDTSVIVVEKDELIARLETEIDSLRNKLIIQTAKAEKSRVFEEGKHDAEMKLRITNEQLGATITTKELQSELASLRQSITRDLLDGDVGVDRSAAQHVLDNLTRLQKRVTQLEAERNSLQDTLADLNEQMAALNQAKKELEANNETEKRARRAAEREAIEKSNELNAFRNEVRIKAEELSRERTRFDTLERQLHAEATNLQTQINELNHEKARLSEEVERAKEQIEHLQNQLESRPANVEDEDEEEGPGEADTALNESAMETTLKAETSATDAGDNTRIFHMPSNPLEMDRAEIRQREKNERKRKADMAGDTGEKRSRSEDLERIVHLEAQVAAAEREKQRAVDITTDLAKKYRELVTNITGYQVKMKDEQICHVTSMFDPSSTPFVFKYDSSLGTVDLLDTGDQQTSIQRWGAFMKHYIGDRHSVPAFLAKVTLALEEDRSFLSESTLVTEGFNRGDDSSGPSGPSFAHTFSVLHED